MLTAASSKEGLVKAEAEQPDAILLDIMMPGMDGLAFLQRQQAIPAIQSIPVIFLTANVELTEPEQFLNLGVKAAIAKPFNPLSLTSQIAKALDWSLVN